MSNMAKLLLTRDDLLLREIPLAKARITMGRRSHNDVVIDDLAISGEHLVIVCSDHEVLLEDLNSTNGTKVNGQPVHRHYLHDGDVIEAGPYRFHFCKHIWSASNDAEVPVIPPQHVRASGPVMRVLSGTKVDTEINLNKQLTTIGCPGQQVAVVSRGESGFTLSQVEGGGPVLVNGESIGQLGRVLCDGDIAAVAGIRLMFVAGC